MPEAGERVPQVELRTVEQDGDEGVGCAAEDIHQIICKKNKLIIYRL